MAIIITAMAIIITPIRITSEGLFQDYINRNYRGGPVPGLH